MHILAFLGLTFFTVVAAAYGSVADIEVLFVIIASIGAIFSLFNVRESFRDWRILDRLGKRDFGPHYDARMVVAWNTLRSEVARALVQMYFVSLGIFAMFIAEVPADLHLHQPLRVIAFGILFRWGLISASILLTLKSYWGYQVRNRVIEHYKDEGVPAPEDLE